MNYYLGLKRLFQAEYPGILVGVDFGYSEIEKYTIANEKYLIIVDEVLSDPVFRSCMIKTTITVDVLYGLRKQGNDILKAKNLRDKIVTLLDGRSQLLDGATLVYRGITKRVGNGRSGHDSKLGIGYHTAEFELVYDNTCVLGCDVL